MNARFEKNNTINKQFVYLQYKPNCCPLKVLRAFLFVTWLLPIGVFSQSCLPDGIEFSTQAQIDSFQINYPGCTEIEGNVNIHSSEISNLLGLNVITEICGSLEITAPQLSGLDGLNNLNVIGGSLSLSGNDSITNLDPLVNLMSINGSLFISGNDMLRNLNGLANLDPNVITWVSIIYNDSLTNCNALSLCNYLSNPTGWIRIAYNKTGCDHPSEIADSCGIILPCLPYGEYIFYDQVQIDSFKVNYPNCEEMNGAIRIRNYISNLHGLDSVSRMDQLHIENTQDLIDMTGLENVSYIGGLYVWENHSLQDLTGLHNLDSIGSSIWFKDNWVLTSMTGLDSLPFMHGSLTITGNPYLTNIEGLSNIDSDSIKKLVIVDNTILSDCDIESICSYLADPGGDIIIQDNNPGCNSQEEVEASCGIGMSELSQSSLVQIYPNPAHDFITILTSERILNVSIYNLVGQKVISKGVHYGSLNISKLEEGLYVVEIIAENTRVRSKLIIN